MLVDLEWKLTNDKYVKEFDTSDGNLLITYKIKEEIFKRYIARRMAKGVYYAFNLWNDIEEYTDWEVVNQFGEQKKIFDQIIESSKNGDKVQADTLRDLLKRFKNEYSNADDLKQVF